MSVCSGDRDGHADGRFRLLRLEREGRIMVLSENISKAKSSSCTGEVGGVEYTSLSTMVISQESTSSGTRVENTGNGLRLARMSNFSVTSDLQFIGFSGFRSAWKHHPDDVD